MPSARPAISLQCVCTNTQGPPHFRGLLREHRTALLPNTRGKALKNVDRYLSDLHAFRIYGEVAVALAALTAVASISQAPVGEVG